MIVKIIIASGVIAFTAWLAASKPVLAGFIIAFPLSSMLALAFNYTEFQDAEKAKIFAQSIFSALPFSLAFFLPFFLADRIRLSFWATYLSGCLLLTAGFFIHRLLMRL